MRGHVSRSKEKTRGTLPIRIARRVLKVDLGKGVGQGFQATPSGSTCASRSRHRPSPLRRRSVSSNGLKTSASAAWSHRCCCPPCYPPPVVWAIGTDVHVEYPLGNAFELAGPQYRLARRAPFGMVQVHGGAARLDADLRGTSLRAVTLAGAVATARCGFHRRRGRRRFESAPSKTSSSPIRRISGCGSKSPEPQPMCGLAVAAPARAGDGTDRSDARLGS